MDRQAKIMQRRRLQQDIERLNDAISSISRFVPLNFDNRDEILQGLAKQVANCRIQHDKLKEEHDRILDEVKSQIDNKDEMFIAGMEYLAGFILDKHEEGHTLPGDILDLVKTYAKGDE